MFMSKHFTVSLTGIDVRSLFISQVVVPQSDLSSTIIISRCYNDVNVFLQLTACSTKIPYLTVIIG